MKRAAFAMGVIVIAIACGGPTQSSTSTPAMPEVGIHKIQHVVVIMQENRSFDHYFGVYPGADGLPRQGGQFTVCVPDPDNGGCVRPYHDTTDKNGGGPHGSSSAAVDINSGKMDGFVGQAEKGKRGCVATVDPNCTNSVKTDVMGYKDARDIPNYWAYASNYVLQDHHRCPGQPARRRRGQGQRPGSGGPQLRVDLADLHALQARHQLAVLRRRGLDA